jgi:hypothetical protein
MVGRQGHDEGARSGTNRRVPAEVSCRDPGREQSRAICSITPVLSATICVEMHRSAGGRKVAKGPREIATLSLSRVHNLAGLLIMQPREYLIHGDG